MSVTEAETIRQPRDRLIGQPQERQHCAAEGGTRDRLPPGEGCRIRVMDRSRTAEERSGSVHESPTREADAQSMGIRTTSNDVSHSYKAALSKKIKENSPIPNPAANGAVCSFEQLDIARISVIAQLVPCCTNLTTIVVRSTSEHTCSRISK